jgi:hypothetical protein
MGFEDVRALLEQGSGSPPSPPSPGAPSEGPFGLLLKGLDYLSRPGRAVSEAVGAASEGEDDLFEAAMRGLKGDYSYGTLGEQLIPDTEGVELDPLEEFIKMGARLAIDMATDPLTYAFVGPLKKPALWAGAKLLKGAEKAGKPLKKIPGLQAISQAALPVTTHLRMWGNVKGGKQYGTLLADGFENVHRNSRIPSGIVEKELIDITKQIGLARPTKDKAARLMAVDHVDTGAFREGIIHEDARVQQFAQWLHDKFQKTGEAAEKYKDLNGKGFRVINPQLQHIQRVLKKRAKKYNISSDTRKEMWEAYKKGDTTYGSGSTANVYQEMRRRLQRADFEDVSGASIWSPNFYSHDFKQLRDYMPRMLSDEAMQKYRDITPEALKAGDVSAVHPAVREFAKANKISTVEAARLLRRFGQPQKAGNIEYARTLKFPEGDLEKDPLKFIPRYYERLFNRMSFGEEFGLDGKQLDKLLDGAIYQAGLSPRYAQAIGEIAKGKRARDYTLDSLARKIMGFQVVTKMGPLSALSNISQNLNTVIRDGGINFTKGILRSMSDEGGRAGVIAWQRGIHDEFLRIAGGEGAVANKYLQWTGFNKAESINRLLASNSSIVSAERLLKTHFDAGGTVDDIPRKLFNRGITPDDAKGFLLNEGKLTQKSADKIGFIGSQATQHATAWKDLPLWWQEPEFRIMMQYKSFIYQQSRFIGREVLQPARRYFESGGSEGSLGPMVRAAIGFGLGAEVVNFIRQNVKKGTGKLAGIEYETEPFDEAHPLWQLMNHAGYVGALGMAGDIVERASRRDLKGWALGPTVGDVFDMFEGVPPTVADVTEQGLIEGMPWRNAWKQIRRRIPGIGTLLPSGRRADEDPLERYAPTALEDIRDLLERASGK